MGHVVRANATALVPVLAAILLAAGTELFSEPGYALPCRVLPNHVVPVMASRGDGCPLQSYDRLIAARVEGVARVTGTNWDLRTEVHRAGMAGVDLRLLVSRRGVEEWVSAPVARDSKLAVFGRFAAALALASSLMAIATLIRLGSSEAAARPFAYFYACVSVMVVSVMSGQHSDALVIPGVIASGLAPATLAHLALTFPREREIVRRSPQMVGAVYGFSTILTLISVINLNRSPAVWMLVDRTLLLLALSAWILLVIACALALQESRSPLERRRAKVLLVGSFSIPVVPIATSALIGGSVPGGSLSLLTITVAVLPLPIGYAISHYRLFDLDLDLRQAISYVLYVALSAAVISTLAAAGSAIAGAGLPFGDPAVLFTVAFFGFLIGDPVRAGLRGAIDSWMAAGASRLARVTELHVRRVSQLSDPDQCAAMLGRTLREGLDPRSTAIFVCEAGDWRLAFGGGPGAPVRPSVALLAAKVAGGASLVHLADECSGNDSAAGPLRELGVEVVVLLQSGRQTLGLALIGAPANASGYTTPQLRFAETVCRQSAVAMHNADLARSLLVSERLATQGRLGAGLIHDLGKPLGVVERLAARLPRRFDDPERLSRDARTIADLASQMRSILRDFLDTTRRAATGQEASSLDAVVGRAVQIVSRNHGPERVSVRIEPDLPEIASGSEKLVRAIANLLENGLLASAADDVVEVSARRSSGQLEIRVIDRGRGMDEALVAQAFEPFFTTRSGGGGSGLGLTVCRDVVEAMGGTVEIASEPGKGTTATIHLPLSEEGRA